MSSRTEEIFNERSNWAMVALVLTVFVGTSLSQGFTLWSPEGVALALGVGAMYLVDWFEVDLRQRYPRAGLVIYHLAQWSIFLAINLTRLPGNFIWLLAMPPFSQAVGRLRWQWASLVGIAYLSVSTLRFQDWKPDWSRTSAFVLSIGVAYIFTAVCTAAMTQAFRAQRRSEGLARELEEANTQLRASAAQQAALAAAEERNRIARDIHDGLGHFLTVVTVQLQAAQALVHADPARSRESLKTAEELTQRALEEVRRSVGALRSAGEQPPLTEAISGLIQETRVPARFRVKGEARPLSAAVQQALFRSAQEGLTNVRKHAHATKVEVQLSYERADAVSLEVVDDGRGDPGEPTGQGGFGLVGLRERVLELGGRVIAGRKAEGGFCLHVEVPA